MAFPPTVNAPAPEMNIMLLNTVSAVRLLLGVVRVVPPNKSKSFARGAVPPQLAPVLQLSSPPTPLHVEVAAKEGLETKAQRLAKIAVNRRQMLRLCFIVGFLGM